jgi:small subunit ribosomal protein S4
VARDTSPQCKQCRREGQKLFLKGSRCFTDKCAVDRRAYPPGEHGRGRMRQSEYRTQLREKQKARRYYQVLESQFRDYYDRASRQPGVTGENLLRMLECRFDNVLVRLGFAASRRQARQFIRHGHWLINGRRVDIPSYQVKPEDVITIKPDSPAETLVREATDLTSGVPAWLQADYDSLSAKVLRQPERSEISAPITEQLIVELYSK